MTSLDVVEVRESDIHDKGLFAKKKITKGTEFFFETPLARSSPSRDVFSIADQVATKTKTAKPGSMIVGAEASLAKAVYRELLKSPEMVKEFAELHSSGVVAPSVSEVDGKPVIDM